MAPATKPHFPPSLEQQDLLPCPSVGSTSSLFTKIICFYVHEWLLKPLSDWYCIRSGIPMAAGAYILPFGLILKTGNRLAEQEGLAMNLARAMGVPAPRFISYGEPPAKYKRDYLPTLLMTRIPGIPLDELEDDQIDVDTIREDFVRILTSMRRFKSPWGNAICGVDGGAMRGPFMPATPLAPCSDQSAFYQVLRQIGRFGPVSERTLSTVARAEALFDLPEHAIVFTHGDLNRHNVILGPDGHISGIFDWEGTAWLPEYWEISVVSLFPRRGWGNSLTRRFLREPMKKRSMGIVQCLPWLLTPTLTTKEIIKLISPCSCLNSKNLLCSRNINSILLFDGTEMERPLCFLNKCPSSLFNPPFES